MTGSSRTELVLAAAVVVATLTGCSGGDRESAGDTDAWVACKSAVEAQLKNPATAGFALMQTTIEPTFIDGILTAKNGFGVEQELQFHCKRAGSTITSTEVLPTR
jgi:hypothetical protein